MKNLYQPDHYKMHVKRLGRSQLLNSISREPKVVSSKFFSPLNSTYEIAYMDHQETAFRLKSILTSFGLIHLSKYTSNKKYRFEKYLSTQP